MLFSIVSTPTYGTASVNSTGLVTYTPNNGYVGTDNFVYKTTDTVTGDSSTLATITITVNEIDVLPPSQTYTIASVNENASSTTYNLTQLLGGVNIDPLRDNNVTVALHNGTGASVASITSANGGTVAIVTGQSLSYMPPTGFASSTPDSFTFTLSDNLGDSVTYMAHVTVNEIDVLPASQTFSQTAAANTTTDFSITQLVGTNLDPFGDNNVTVMLQNAQGNSVQSITSAYGGAVSIVDGQTISYTPATSFTGTDIFNYTLDDNLGDTVTYTEHVTVP